MKKLLDGISKLQVAVIGDVILDHFAWGKVSRISPEAPVPVVDVERDVWFSGGAANVAIDVASMKAPTTLYGSSADDTPGETLSDLLLNAQIYYDRFLPSEGSPTAVKTRIAASGQQLLRIDRAANPKEYSPSIGYVENMLKSLDKFDAVIISDYARGFLNDEIVNSVIETMRAAKKFVSIDPKPRHRLNFCRPNLMTANREEAFALAEMPDNDSELPICELAQKIYDRYKPDHTVITLGGDGMYLCRGPEPLRHIPPAAREVSDPAGAGDAVIASLSLALAAGEPVERAARFANVAAGIVVGKMGSTTVSAQELSSHDF